MKVGRFSEQNAEEVKRKELEEEEAAKAITVGLRCEVTAANGVKRRGLVMFVGKGVVVIIPYYSGICWRVQN